MRRNSSLLTVILAIALVGALAGRSTAADEPAAGVSFPARAQLQPGTPQIALRLLQKDVVVKDLALTDGQQKNIKEISDQFAKDLTQLGSGHSEEQIHKSLLLTNATAEKILGALNEQQRARFRQIRIQVSSGFALIHSPIVAELQLSDEQSESVRKLQHQWLVDEIAMRKETTDTAEQRAKGKKMSQELRKSFEALLTPEQQRQFEAMQGKKIDISGLSSTVPEKDAKAKGSGQASGGTGTYRRE